MNTDKIALNLKQTQQLFFRAICYPTGIDDFVNSLSPAEQDAFRSTFVGTEGFAANERLSLYADAYFYRLKEVLEDTFAVTSDALGPERFHNLVTDYVLDCGSESPSLHDLGSRFPEYLENHDASERCPIQADERARLVSLANVERALAKALEAADTDLLSVQTLAQVAPSDWQILTFTFVPSLELIWGGGVYTDKDAPADSPLVVWRKCYKTMTKVVSQREAHLLQALQNGQTFAEGCEVFENSGGSAADVAVTLAAWIERGWLAAA